MNALKAIVLILVVTASSCYNSLVMVFFEYHQSYFAAELCEQKEVVENSCQGSCQLHALLQTREEPQEPKAPIFSEELVFMPAHLKAFTLHTPHVLQKEPLVRIELDGLSAGVKRLVWRPPCRV